MLGVHNIRDATTNLLIVGFANVQQYEIGVMHGVMNNRDTPNMALIYYTYSSNLF